MNSSSAFKQRSGARSQRKSADKGEREVFIQSAGGGAAEDSTFARDYARNAAAKNCQNKRSWADVVSGQRKEKGPEASFIHSANAAREQERAAAHAVDSEQPPRAFTYAEVVGGAAKQQQGQKKSLIDEEEQARAAFAALASSRARVDLDLSRIAADNDAIILIDQGKGGDVEGGANDQRRQGRDGGEDNSDGDEEDHNGNEQDRNGNEQDLNGNEQDRKGDEQDGDGNEQDHDDYDGDGIQDQEPGSFIRDKKARRADERRRREEERNRVATKAARKLEDLERKLQEEEAAKREASALRKRNRSKSPKSGSQQNEPARASEVLGLRSDGNNNTRVNAPPPPFPVFVRQQQRKAASKDAAKAAKKARRSQRGEGDREKPDSISDGQRAPLSEQRAIEPPSGSGQSEGEGSQQRRDADGGEGDRRVRQRDDTEGPAAASSRRERRALEKSVRASSRRVEFERHREKSNRRKKGRESARGLVKAALYQLKRQSKGELLDSNEQQLATYAAHLSPAKILGAGIRIGAASSGEGSESEDGLDLLETTNNSDESVDELVEELGCSAAEARDALNRSYRWTASGNSSRIKAANWLRRELEEQVNRNRDKYRRTQATGGFAHRDEQRENPFDVRGRLPRPRGPAAQDHSRTDDSAAPATRGQNSENRQPSRNSVPNGPGSGFGSTMHQNGANPSSSSKFSSKSSLSNGSESASDSSDNGASAKRRKQAPGSFLSLNRSRKAPADRHESRYLRNLGKLLLIDEGEAKEVYAETQAKVQRWNRSVTILEEGDKPPGGPSPTFTLPDWCSGQPPIGGLHFSTLKDMLAAYEKFERQTNYQTSVTFKSMIKTTLRPSFESKCKLPRAV
jgi:hypothetical protein